MRKVFLLSLLLLTTFVVKAQQTFHDFTVISIAGDTIPLSQYYGKKVLVVNTASYCGYTYQFGLLQALDSTYSNYNFEVVGFPCNDFGGQDPYADSVIENFCTSNYGVSFQMMKKISITAVDTADVYKWLQRADLNGVANAPVSWNFNKFCIDEAGHWVKHFDSPVTPFDTAITNWITSPSVTGIQQPALPFPVTVQLFPQDHNLRFQLQLTKPEDVDISVISAEGKKVANIYHGRMNASATLNYETSDFSTGMYFVKIRSGNAAKTVKIFISK